MAAEQTHDSNQNSRRYPRRYLETRVAVLRSAGLHFEKSVQVSEGGMLIWQSLALDMGTSVEIRFFLPNGRYISTIGEVIYCLQPEPGKHQAGIRFLTIKPEDVSALQDFTK